MLIASIVTALFAVLLAVLGVFAMLRAPEGSPQRMMAPAQLAAAAMLAVAAVLAFSTPAALGLVAVAVCALAAIGTLGAAAWQLAKAATLAEQVAAGGCGSVCGGCPSSGAVCERP